MRGPTLVLYQMQAIFLKKFLYLLRNIPLLMQLLVVSANLTFFLLFTPEITYSATPHLEIGFSSYEDFSVQKGVLRNSQRRRTKLCSEQI